MGHILITSRLARILSDKEKEIARIDVQNQTLSRDIERYDQQIRQLQNDLVTERNQVKSLNEKIAEKGRDHAKITESNANNEDLIIQLKGDMVTLKNKNEDLQKKINKGEKEAGALIESDNKNREMIGQLQNEISKISIKYDLLNNQFTEAQKSISQYAQKEEGRVHDHEQRIAGLNSLQKQLEEKLQQIAQEREDEIHRQYTEMERTWLNHEKLVEETLQNICRQHNIEYCDKENFPYSGKPDNSVIICNQYVIFDAKSPEDSENLDNFPAYIKSQAQSVKKYVKGDDIKRDVFLVVPTNAITSLPETVYRIGEVRVYVVTTDSIEPIILALKKIEEYTFVEQLSPEDRENICQVIGKFVHASKRKIQIDTYFSKLFIELLENCDSSLPQNIRDKLDEIEKSEIMNPPAEQRNKMTPLPSIVKSVKVLEKEVEAHEVEVTAVSKEKLETIPLHKFLE